MNWNEMKTVIEDAEQSIRTAEGFTSDMVRFISKNNRIKSTINNYQTREALRRLKRSLKDFNMNTGEWK